MHKFFTLLMRVTLRASLLACCQSNALKKSDSSTALVDNGLKDVTISLPASMFEGEEGSTFDSEAYTKEHGFKETIVNADGSIAVTMSKNKHNELLKKLRASVEESFASLIEAVDTPYIKEISSNSGYQEIPMSVDRVGYEEAIFELTPFILAMNAGMYQLFEGTTPDVQITILDVLSQEVINTIIYPDDFNME